MSMCRVFSCVVGRGCLLWPVHSLGKILLAFALLHFVLQGQICLLLQVSLDFLLLHFSPLWWKGHLRWVLDLEGIIVLHRTVQFQLLQHYWLRHRLGLLWYWMVCFGIEQRSFCHFWDCTQVLNFRFFVDCGGYSISSKGFLPMIIDIMVIWIKFTYSSPFLKCQCSLLPSPVWPLPTFLDSWTQYSRFPCNIALYNIRLYFHHQSHPQLSTVFTLAPPLHSFWSYFSTLLQ